MISQNRNRKEKRLWTERKGGDLIKYFRGSDELEEADFITRTAHSGITSAPDCTVAVLYRTNAQSRVIEDSLMRSGLAYRIVGGVRFYERKEIKDSLAYLKLLINPHDDVSLRRVINVPPRGIGKGVLESRRSRLGRRSAASAARERHRRARAELAVDEAERAPSTSAWCRSARWRRCGRSAISSSICRTSRARNRCRSRSARCSIRAGYLQDLREDKSEDSQGRIENLMELVSAAREYEGREPEASLGGFTDKLSLLSEVDEGQGSVEARIWLMTLHAAKGLEFPTVIMAGLEEGVFPHSRAFDEEDEMAEERRLCYVGMTRARSQLVLTGAARRRVFGEYQSMEPSRFMDEVPPQLVERIEPAYPTSSYQSSFGGGYGAFELVRPRLGSKRRSLPPTSTPKATREEPAYAYEDEDQSSLLGPQARRQSASSAIRRRNDS